MSALLCCRRRRDMGAALHHTHHQEGEERAAGDAPLTMAEVIRERKKKAGVAGLGTLRRRLAAAARRTRDHGQDRGCEHARLIRTVVSSWRLAEVCALHAELEAGSALRDLATQADLAREPAPALAADLLRAYRDRWCCDVELVHRGVALPAHRALLCARSRYFRALLHNNHGCGPRVQVEGLPPHVGVDELRAVLATIYGEAATDRECVAECGGELDIINADRSNGYRTGSTAATRRTAAELGVHAPSLQADCTYLLDSGEYADARLVFWSEGGAGEFGFRPALELPCHRLVLAARSRFFRSVLCRRSGAGSDAVCVDEKVLPRRFARALLHAAYTDQVDLTLIDRSTSSSPSSTTNILNVESSANGKSYWTRSQAQLEDAFQLYEIARFLEMAIVVQGCEDAIAEALCPDTLPAVLRWAAAPHASHWLHRQAMRYLRDEFTTVCSGGGVGRLPRAALAAALGSPFLQAAEAQALRAVIRWGEHHHQQREPNVVWHTGRGGKRREGSDAALRETIAPLVPLLRLEHVPRDCDLLNQALRRGLVPQPPTHMVEGGSSADAWLGRGPYRPPRVFLPYLDEIKTLLEDQSVSEEEVARVRRTRYLHRIPDTLYMVQAERGEDACAGSGVVLPAGSGAEGWCVSPRVLRALRGRVRELQATPPAARALSLPAAQTALLHAQICLRAVREHSLPDACAELLVADLLNPQDTEDGGGAEGGGWCDGDDCSDDDCCREGESAARPRSANSLRRSTHTLDGTRSASCRRDLPAVVAEPARDRSLRVGGGGARWRLSAAVPDVAMAPNANTHLLTARDYCTPHHTGYSAGAVLQLDLGDGATHTPRPGSRAQRAARHHRDPHQLGVGVAADDELRAAIELSVIRAYSAFQPRPASPHAALPPAAAGPLPAVHAHHPRSSRHDRTAPAHHSATVDRTAHMLSRSEESGHVVAHSHAPTTSHTLDRLEYANERSARGNISHRSVHAPTSSHTVDRAEHVAGRAAQYNTLAPLADRTGHYLSHLSGLSPASCHSSGSLRGEGAGGSLHRTPSPRHYRRPDYSHYRPPADYRLEGSYSGSSRGPSPNNYA